MCICVVSRLYLDEWMNDLSAAAVTNTIVSNVQFVHHHLKTVSNSSN